MALRLAIALEIMAVIVCIHRLYDKKVKLDISTILLYLGCMIIFDAINMHGFSTFCMTIAYVLMGVYCVSKYKDSVKGAMLSVLITLIIVGVMQFLGVWIVDFLIRMEELKRMVTVNALVLISCIWMLPKCRLNMLRNALKKYDVCILALLSFALCVVFVMQLQERIYGMLYLELFALVIPAIVLLLVLAVKWVKEREEKQNVEQELQTTASMQEKYEELLKIVRMKQHEFKNHLSAIFSAHYTYQSYDKLIKAQKEYCGELVQENRYSNLLSLKDSVLAGFLYGRFQEMEADGINVECKIIGEFQQTSIPEFRLVEMVGILLDNAAQAVQKEEPGRLVRFKFEEKADQFWFHVLNKYPPTSYEEIEKWFQMGSSTKGEGRGIGLYHIKCLCKELGCEILCHDTEIDKENWIEFILMINKADMK